MVFDFDWEQFLYILARHLLHTVEKMPEGIAYDLAGRFSSLPALSSSGLNYAQ